MAEAAARLFSVLAAFRPPPLSLALLLVSRHRCPGPNKKPTKSHSSPSNGARRRIQWATLMAGRGRGRAGTRDWLWGAKVQPLSWARHRRLHIPIQAPPPNFTIINQRILKVKGLSQITKNSLSSYCMSLSIVSYLSDVKCKHMLRGYSWLCQKSLQAGLGYHMGCCEMNPGSSGSAACTSVLSLRSLKHVLSSLT